MICGKDIDTVPAKVGPDKYVCSGQGNETPCWKAYVRKVWEGKLNGE
jgi:hypothetical protein